MEDKGTTLTPIFQFAKNNGLDEKEFFDFVKSKTGVDITPEHRETQGFLEKMFDEYADKKFKERPKRDIFTDKAKKYLDFEDTDKSLDAIKDNFTPPGAKDEVDMTIYKEDEDRFGKDALSGLTGPRESEQLKEEIDTNDNGKIEVDEMADFQKSLDDYAAKNKKGRDDIPVTTRR
jgi:hypothetical protein